MTTPSVPFAPASPSPILLHLSPHYWEQFFFTRKKTVPDFSQVIRLTAGLYLQLYALGARLLFYYTSFPGVTEITELITKFDQVFSQRWEVWCLPSKLRGRTEIVLKISCSVSLVTYLSPVTGSTLRRVIRSRMVSVGASMKITLNHW